MNTSSVLANLLRLRQDEARVTAAEHDTDETVRLLPVAAPDELPPEFEDVLKIQVLGYRERLIVGKGSRVRVLEPVWTLVPKDR